MARTDDYIPARQSEFVGFTRSMAKALEADPQRFATTAAVAGEYAELQRGFAEAYRLCIEPSTNTTVAMATKKARLKLLKTRTREIVQGMRADPTVSDEVFVLLGLDAPRPRRRRLARLRCVPRVLMVKSTGRTLTVRLGDGIDNGKRGKPAETAGAFIYSYLGEHPSGDIEAWRFEGGKTTAEFRLRIRGAESPGTKVSLCAAWVDSRLRPGPMSEPVSVRIGWDGSPQVSERMAA